MEREKFDDRLSAVLLEHEETVTPVFNRERVWNNTRTGKGRSAWYAVASVAAVLTLIFTLLFNRDEPVKRQLVTREKAQPTIDHVIADAKPKQENAGIILNNNTKPVSRNMQVVIPKDTSAQTETVAAIEKPVIANVQLPDPLQGQSTTITAEQTASVVFKRGKTPEPASTLKTAELKEVRLQFKPHSGSQNDTTYYVNSNPLKLTLKARQ